MPTDQIFAGYTAYTETEDVLAATDVDPDELASIWVSSVPCVNFTVTVTVAFSC